jgi:type II restriction enzyme
MPGHLAANYNKPSQQARVVSETWGQDNLYCPNCESPFLRATTPNTPAVDFICPRCESPFQLKSQSKPIGNRIADAAYSVMIRAIEEDRTLNLYALHYNRMYWQVRNLILIPHFAFSASAIKPRKPISPSGRRAGWIGCDIVLSSLPSDVRIEIISNGVAASPKQVRESFQRLRPLEEIGPMERGWTLDVLRIVRALGKTEFSNNDVYAFAPQLEKLHPNNRHVRDKIRQQLQVLRDKGFLIQVERGTWALKE